MKNTDLGFMKKIELLLIKKIDHPLFRENISHCHFLWRLQKPSTELLI